jgi:hypothetical protein
VRAEFRGPIGYVSPPFEGVDWPPFGIVAADAAYSGARTSGRLGHSQDGTVHRGGSTGAAVGEERLIIRL